MVDHSAKGKIVLVTGGAKSLGGLIARDLTTRGTKVIAIHYNSATSKTDADATVAALQVAGTKTVTLQGDLINAAAMEELFAGTIAAMGKPDITTNTAGEVLEKPFIEISEVKCDEMSTASAKSASFFLREIGKHANNSGRTCTLVTSLFGAYTPYYVAYTDTKAPVEHFTHVAPKESGAYGISTTTVSPGSVNTSPSYPAKSADTMAYHKTTATLSPFSKTGLIDAEGITPFIRHLVNKGWWVTDQTILINDSYTIK